jgi:hypothetical protein
MMDMMLAVGAAHWMMRQAARRWGVWRLYRTAAAPRHARTATPAALSVRTATYGAGTPDPADKENPMASNRMTRDTAPVDYKLIYELEQIGTETEVVIRDARDLRDADRAARVQLMSTYNFLDVDASLVRAYSRWAYGLHDSKTGGWDPTPVPVYSPQPDEKGASPADVLRDMDAAMRGGDPSDVDETYVYLNDSLRELITRTVRDMRELAYDRALAQGADPRKANIDAAPVAREWVRRLVNDILNNGGLGL